MNGMASRVKAPIEQLAMLQVMNMFVPTGGVITPRTTFRTKTTPKCTGSMPYFVMTCEGVYPSAARAGVT